MQQPQEAIMRFVSSYNAFINYLRKKKVFELTASGNPKGNDTFAINELFDNDVKQPNVTIKTQYPAIFLVKYFIGSALFMEILEYAQDKKGKEILLVNEEVLEKYDLLSNEEKYLSFFHAFWFGFNYQENDIHFTDVDSLVNFIEYLAESKRVETLEFKRGRLIAEEWRFNDWIGTLSLFHTLGFCELDKDLSIVVKDKYKETNCKAITTNPFGIKMAKIIYHKFPFELCNLSVDFLMFGEDDDEYNEEDYPHFDLKGRKPILKDPFISFFKEIFPEAEMILLPKTPEKSLEGNYYFKVALNHDKKVYRVVALHSSNTLDDLHYAIQDAFNLDDDHLYQFTMGIKSGDVYESPRMKEFDDDGYGNGDGFADEIIIQELTWKPNFKFSYLFDFGANLLLDCIFLKADTSEKPLKKHKIVEKAGKFPKQD